MIFIQFIEKNDQLEEDGFETILEGTLSDLNQATTMRAKALYSQMDDIFVKTLQIVSRLINI